MELEEVSLAEVQGNLQAKWSLEQNCGEVFLFLFLFFVRRNQQQRREGGKERSDGRRRANGAAG